MLTSSRMVRSIVVVVVYAAIVSLLCLVSLTTTTTPLLAIAQSSYDNTVMEAMTRTAPFSGRQYAGLLILNATTPNVPATIPFVGGASSSATPAAGHMILFGGVRTPNGGTTNDVWYSTNSGAAFNNVSIPTGFGFDSEGYGPASCVDRTRNILYSIAGDAANNRDGDSTFWASTNLGLTWTVANGPFIGRTSAVCFVDSTSRVYLIGGKWASATGLDISNDVWMATLTSISPLTLSWTQMSAAAPFAERDAPSGDSYYSPRHQTDILYLTTGYLYTNTLAESQDDGTGINDVWVSVDRGASWTLLTMAAFPPRYHSKLIATKDGVLVLVAGTQDEPPVIVNGQISQASSYLRNDMWASLDGGYTWGRCTDAVFPMWNDNTNATLFQRGAGRADSIAQIDPTTGILYVGSGLQRDLSGGKIAVSDILRTRFSFYNFAAVGAACGLSVPPAIGLQDLSPFIASSSSYTLSNNPNSSLSQIITTSSPWTARQQAGMHFVRNASISVSTSLGVVSSIPSSFVIFGGVLPTASGAAALVTDMWYSASLGSAYSRINFAGTYQFEAYGPATCSDPARNILYMIGGDAANDRDGDAIVWYSTDLAQSWTLLAAPFIGRTNAVCFVDSTSRVYVIGGKWASTTGVDISNDVWMAVPSTTSSPLSLAWTQMSAAAPFAERDAASATSYYSARHQTDILYMSTGYLYTNVLAESQDDGTGINDVWVSVDRGASWTLLTMAAFPPRYHSKLLSTKDGVLVLVAGSQDEPPVIVNGQISQAPSYVRNDLWASMDGGYTWGMCFNRTFPMWGSVNATLYARGSGRADALAAIDPNTGVLYMGGGLGRTQAGDKWGPTDMLRTTFSFFNLSAVSKACGLAIPAATGLQDLSPFIASSSSYIPLSVNSTFLQVITSSASWPARQHGGLHIIRNTTLSISTALGLTQALPSSFVVFGGLVPGVGSSTAATNDVWYSASLGSSYSRITISSTFNSEGYGPATCSDPARNILYSIGGDLSNDRYGTSQVWMSTDLGQSWTMSTAQFPGRTNALCLVDSSSRVFVFGGKWASTTGTDVSNDVWMGTLSTSTPLTLTWTQRSSAAPFSERDGLAGATFYSSSLGTDVLYVSTGYVYTGPLSETEDDGTGTNDVWVSTNSGATWGTLGNAAFPPRYHSKMLSTKDGVLLMISGEQDDPAVVSGTTITQAPPYMRNDLWASMDGGYTWGMCSNQTFPGYNGLAASLFPRGVGRQDALAAIDPNTGVLYMGSGLQYSTTNAKIGTSDLLRSTISFHNVTSVARACQLLVPSALGLAVLPPVAPGGGGSSGGATPARLSSSTGGGATPARLSSSVVGGGGGGVIAPSSAPSPDVTASTGVPPTDAGSGSSSLSGGAIAGIVIACLVGLVLLLAAVFVFKARASKGSAGLAGIGTSAHAPSHLEEEPSAIEMSEVHTEDGVSADGGANMEAAHEDAVEVETTEA